MMVFSQINSRMLLFAVVLYINCFHSVVNLRESYNKKYPNGITVSLNETLRQIYDKDFQIQKNFVGPNFRVSKNSEVRYKCEDLMNDVIKYDAKARSPCTLTPELQKMFTMDGLMDGGLTCAPQNHADIQNGIDKQWIWSYDSINSYDDGALSRCGAYANSACIEAVEKYGNEYIKDKVGMVIGTQDPWAERGLIHHGAKHVITVEYMKIVSQHPKLSTMHPVEAAKNFLANNFTLVDFIFSYSSLEHDGLGRYGDPINPFADLESIARAQCMLKPHGVLFLGFPVGPDQISNYWHRIYGKYRMSLILSMWEPIDLINSYLNLSDPKSHLGDNDNQPIWVLKKKQRKQQNHSSPQAVIH